MKKCNKCGDEKDYSEFGKGKGKKDGLQDWCKICRSIASKSEDGKASRRMYRRSDKAKAAHKRYMTSDKGKAVKKKSKKKSQEKYLNAVKSQHYYYYRKDKLNLPDRCETCGSKKKIEAHHGDYNKPMEVVILCEDHHKKWHTKNTPLNRSTGIFTENKS